ncbi:MULTISPECIES: hypothetical protein [unclassified Nonomuraea]|uniref:hypothetical protein n=1 Tax=unclassified Nonomuraea TaxID=2593643 RepID=UPI0033EB490B
MGRLGERPRTGSSHGLEDVRRPGRARPAVAAHEAGIRFVHQDLADRTGVAVSGGDGAPQEAPHTPIGATLGRYSAVFLFAYFAPAFGVKGLQLSFGPGTFWIQPLFQGAALMIAVALASRQITHTRRCRRAQARRTGPDDASVT